MPNFANITLTGHLGQDSELKQTASGLQVISFTLAVNTGIKDKKLTSWYNCTLFGKQAETMAQYLKKGTAITVNGEPSIREWEKDGKKGKSFDVKVNVIAFAGGKNEENNSADKKPVEPSQPALYDDTIPF